MIHVVTGWILWALNAPWWVWLFFIGAAWEAIDRMDNIKKRLDKHHDRIFKIENPHWDD